MLVYILLVNKIKPVLRCFVFIKIVIYTELWVHRLTFTNSNHHEEYTNLLTSTNSNHHEEYTNLLTSTNSNYHEEKLLCYYYTISDAIEKQDFRLRMIPTNISENLKLFYHKNQPFILYILK